MAKDKDNSRNIVLKPLLTTHFGFNIFLSVFQDPTMISMCSIGVLLYIICCWAREMSQLFVMGE